MLRRTKTIVFRDDEPEESGARGRSSSMRGGERRQFEPEQAAPEPETLASIGANERLNFLRAELEDNPISKGSPQSLEALRAEFQRTLASRVDDGLSVKSERSLPGFLKPSRILLVAVALLAGGTAAFLAFQRAPEAEPVAVSEPAPVVEAPMTQILVAKAPIGVGQRLTDVLLEWQPWPDAALRPEYITAAATPEALTDMGDNVARMAFVAGEPIRREKLGAAGKGYLSALLESGMRGVSVTIEAKSSSGGFIVPNDHVDVVLTRSSETGERLSQTILHNVRVVAIDARLGETDAPAADAVDPQSGLFADSAIATLELDPAASELLINATTMGSLSLVLRPTADATKAPTASQTAVNQAIRLSSPFWNSRTQP